MTSQIDVSSELRKLQSNLRSIFNSLEIQQIAARKIVNATDPQSIEGHKARTIAKEIQDLLAQLDRLT